MWGEITAYGSGDKPSYPERGFSPPEKIGDVAVRAARRNANGVGAFIVPAIVSGAALDSGDVAADKILAFTALCLDIDSGDIAAKVAFVTRALGEPS